MNFIFSAYFIPNTQQDSKNDSMTQNTKLKGETRLKWRTYSIILSHFLLLSDLLTSNPAAPSQQLKIQFTIVRQLKLLIT